MFFNRRQSDFILLSSPQNFHQFAKMQFFSKIRRYHYDNNKQNTSKSIQSEFRAI